METISLLKQKIKQIKYLTGKNQANILNIDANVGNRKKQFVFAIVLVMCHPVDVSYSKEISSNSIERSTKKVVNKVGNSHNYSERHCNLSEKRLSKKEIVHLLKKAQLGDATSSYKLGVYYDLEQTCYEESVYWLQKAANGNLPQAQFYLGSVLFRNKNRSSQMEAVKWLEIAEKNGITQAIETKDKAVQWLKENP